MGCPNTSTIYAQYKIKNKQTHTKKPIPNLLSCLFAEPHGLILFEIGISNVNRKIKPHLKKTKTKQKTIWTLYIISNIFLKLCSFC